MTEAQPSAFTNWPSPDTSGAFSSSSKGSLSCRLAPKRAVKQGAASKGYETSVRPLKPLESLFGAFKELRNSS